MGVVGGRRAAAATLATGALLLSGLAACSRAPDPAHAVRSGLRHLDQVRAAEVTRPGPDRAAAIRITYAAAVDDAAGLAALVSAVTPESELTVGDGFGDGRGSRAVLRTRLTDTLLGAVSYAVGPDGESIRVRSGGGAAHDVARARRIGHGSGRTVWVFDSGPGTFAATGRVTGRDLRLFEAVQRGTGAEGRPVWVPSWQLDCRAGHVRLDPTVDVDLPAWLRLHATGTGPDDVFGSWASDRPAARGRDRLDRGWDTWLARQPRADPGQPAGSATYVVSRYSSMPSKPPSRPKPLALTPPNGAAGLEISPELMPTMPYSSDSATRMVRARSRV